MSKRFDDAMSRLAGAEESFANTLVLSPVLGSGIVRVRIAGVICDLQAEPADFTGWGVFRAASMKQARLERRASMAERRQYLDMLPAVRLILLERTDAHWLSSAAHKGDSRMKLQGLAPVYLVEECQPFDQIVARFDGTNLLFDDLDPRGEAAAAAFLREQFNQKTAPGDLHRRGMTGELREAYGHVYAAWQEAERRAAEEERQARRQTAEGRLQDAVEHAGGRLRSWVEHRHGYRVVMRVEGSEHVVSVDKNDLSVQSAGICLDGEDMKFDLQSLVSVLREYESLW